MNLTLALSAAASIAAASAGFGTAWWIQGVNITRMEQQHASTLASIGQAASDAFQSAQSQIIQAQNDAKRYLAVVRSDADRVRQSSDGLRESIAIAVQASREGHDACIERAATIGVVLNECQNALGEMAAHADGHAIDVKQLMRACPAWDIVQQ